MTSASVRIDPEALRSLACPHCASGLSQNGGSIVCPNAHAFDIARQGYVNLLRPKTHTGTADTRHMVAARARVLASGVYEPIADAAAQMIASRVDRSAPGVVVDVGAGTGWLTARTLDAMSGRSGVALDISKHAARHAAAAHPRLAAVVGDAWGTLPVRSGAACCVLSFFAPRNPPEFARILAPTGVALVIAPLADHLQELAEPLGLISMDPRKDERLAAAFGGLFRELDSRTVRYPAAWTRAMLADLVAMGPSARHRDADEVVAAADALGDEASATIAVTLRLFVPAP